MAGGTQSSSLRMSVALQAAVMSQVRKSSRVVSQPFQSITEADLASVPGEVTRIPHHQRTDVEEGPAPTGPQRTRPGITPKYRSTRDCVILSGAREGS